MRANHGSLSFPKDSLYENATRKALFLFLVVNSSIVVCCPAFKSEQVVRELA